MTSRFQRSGTALVSDVLSLPASKKNCRQEYGETFFSFVGFSV